jgi:hypothetical protein
VEVPLVLAVLLLKLRFLQALVARPSALLDQTNLAPAALLDRAMEEKTGLQQVLLSGVQLWRKRF